MVSIGNVKWGFVMFGLFSQSTWSHGEEGINVWGHRLWWSLWTIVGDNIPILVDEELAKVPWNISATKIRLFSEILVCSVSIISIYIGFLHNSEFDVIFLLEINDLLSCSRFLISKLIAWICNNFESFTFVLLVKFNKLLVVRIGKSSLRSNIHN